jgi:hypothetical protein
MSNLPTDRDQNYMKNMWGTTKLVTDYNSLSDVNELEAKPATIGGSHFSHGHGFFTARSINDEKMNASGENAQFIQEIADYESNHDLKKQSELHEKIRNDDDYDDWSYGTEPIYGKKW